MKKSAKIAKINFRECDGMYEDPVVMVTDYVFGYSHGDSDVSWLFRKLERYQNDFSFTSNSYMTTGKEEDIVTSRLICVPPTNSNSPTCKKALWKADEDDSTDIGVSERFVPFNGVTSPKLTLAKISSICRRLRKGILNHHFVMSIIICLMLIMFVLSVCFECVSVK